MQGEKLMKLETKRFLELIAEHTDMLIDVVMINHQGLIDRASGKRICLADSVTFEEAYSILINENAWWKNHKRKENLYFCWSRKNKGFNIASVDDITGAYAEAFIQKNHLALIKTSEGKHQGLFKLDRYVSSQELLEIQRTLTSLYHGDKGATGAYQLKRLVGFANTKYSDMPIVSLEHTGDSVISVDKIMAFIQEQKKKQEKEIEKKLQSINRNRIIQGEIKQWIDFYDGDESTTDMKYALHLLRRGFSADEVKEKLLKESQDIHTRKRKYVDDYLDKTIAKAMRYIGNLEPSQ